MFENPSLKLEKDHSHSGKVTWRSPSNIALVKYWGKNPVQIPQNASISLTLDEAYTDTSIYYGPRNDERDWIEFLFEGQKEPSFAKRIERFLNSILVYFPFLTQLNFKIESQNSFPHSSGIASSASSMSTLALGLCEIENQLFKDSNADIDLKKVSFIARLGSGSASRSVYPHAAVWGKSDHIKGSSDLFAIPHEDIHSIYKSFHDDVVIVSSDKKSVSSSAGHDLMNSNIFAASRYQQANANLKDIIEIMRSNDLFRWGEIVEREAMTLHALMMCSTPSYMLMKPATLLVIEALRDFRKSSGIPLYFTLDAGPNIHILYPDVVRSNVVKWLDELITALPEHCYIIKDQVGQGPLKLENA